MLEAAEPRIIRRVRRRELPSASNAGVRRVFALLELAL
jgi:hypothetical protein